MHCLALGCASTGGLPIHSYFTFKGVPSVFVFDECICVFVFAECICVFAFAECICVFVFAERICKNISKSLNVSRRFFQPRFI